MNTAKKYMNKPFPTDKNAIPSYFQEVFYSIKNEIKKVIVGQEKNIDLLLIAILMQGHVILVGVPGLAKTLLVQILSQVLDLKFSRIQFTPDLMPSDITGTEIMEEDKASGSRSFRFVRGPIFANIILADEINRTPPKTQSALLEAMQEYHVTTSGITHHIDKPFFVLATQNPIEQEGTYPLPEAQLDRFTFYLPLDYPSFKEEVDIVSGTTKKQDVSVQKVLDQQTLLKMQDIICEVPVPESILEYAVRIAHLSRSTRPDAPEWVKKYISWGAGPRASQNMILASKVRALIQGRFNVIQEDINAVAIPVLSHRLVRNFAAESENLSTEIIIEKLLKEASKNI